MIFKDLFKAVQEKLMPAGNKDLIKFYSYNWGQIDQPEDEDHLIMPCALFSLSPSQFTSAQRMTQNADIRFELQLVVQNYAEANSRSKDAQINRALEFLTLFESVYTLLHNWTPDVDGVSTLSCEGIVRDPVSYDDLTTLTIGFRTNGRITTKLKTFDEITQEMRLTLNLS